MELPRNDMLRLKDVLGHQRKYLLVRLTLPGYNNFSRSLSVVFEGGDPTCGVADDNDAFTGNGLGGVATTSTSEDGDRLCVIGLGSSGVAALPKSVIASNCSSQLEH